MTEKALLAMVLAGFSTAAVSSQNSIDLRLVSGVYEIEDGFDDLEADGGGGFNIKGHFPANEHVFFRANYLTAEPDDVERNGQLTTSESEGTFLRAGLGIGAGNESLRYYGALEYGEVELALRGPGGRTSAEDEGFILSGGLRDTGESAFLWEVEFGLVQFDDVDGTAFEFALGYRVNEQVAILLSGQSYAVDDDVAEYTLGHGMLGARLSF